MDQFKVTIEKAMKFKEKLIAKNLTKGKTPCWKCHGMVYAKLYPNRRSKSGYHIHLSCDGDCGTVFME